MADTLSRASLHISATDDITSDTEGFIQSIILALPAAKDSLDLYCIAQREDPICSKLIKFSNSSWPNRNMLKSNLKKYWQFFVNFTVNDDILLFGILD